MKRRTGGMRSGGLGTRGCGAGRGLVGGLLLFFEGRGERVGTEGGWRVGSEVSIVGLLLEKRYVCW